MNKAIAVILIAMLVLSSLVMIGCVFAQSIPTPSAPEFSLKITDNPFYVPPKYSTPDPYTGETRLIDDGYWAQNGTIKLTIKNQPLASSNDGNGHDLYLFYTIEKKGHFEGIWDAFPASFEGPKQYLLASNSDVTVVNVFYGGHTYARPGKDMKLGEIPDDGEVDFRVRAFIGYNTTFEGIYIGKAGMIETKYYTNYTGQKSDWSDIQTISIPDGAVSKSQSSSSPATTPTQTPTPEQTPATSSTPTPTQEPSQEITFEVITGAAIVVAVISVGLGLLIFLIKRK